MAKPPRTNSEMPLVAPGSRSEPVPPEPGSEGSLVVKYAANGGLVVQFMDDALYAEAIQGAIAEAKTYGEFRRLLPKGEWESIIERLATPEAWETEDQIWYEDPDFDWNTPFDGSCIAGYDDGDYPGWAQAELDAVLPAAILAKYATAKDSIHNGRYWHIPHDSAPALIADLKALGYNVEDNANFLRGW